MLGTGLQDYRLTGLQAIVHRRKDLRARATDTIYLFHDVKTVFLHANMNKAVSLRRSFVQFDSDLFIGSPHPLVRPNFCAIVHCRSIPWPALQSYEKWGQKTKLSSGGIYLVGAIAGLSLSALNGLPKSMPLASARAKVAGVRTQPHSMHVATLTRPISNCTVERLLIKPRRYRKANESENSWYL